MTFIRAHALLLIAIIVIAAIPTLASQAPVAKSWLDRPLVSWNMPGATLPKPPVSDESRDEVLKRCRLALLGSTPAERALADLGWIPYLHFDRRLVQGDVEIVDGMVAADDMCRPVSFNVFVFVNGRFAGTLSPSHMRSRLDGSAGAVRIVSNDAITAEFARYRDDDPLCCPSSRVTARYRIDRSRTQPAVMPVEVRKTRG